ncbi:P-loop containing nucleoside triphosphate hydrolase protein [Xylaria digitata]|nr:P-loop containing nucleoside triphosphate hydrolase protein [Xylaria digitata]
MIRSFLSQTPLQGRREVGNQRRGRIVPMRVLVLGMGRTGTTCYEDTYHMISASVDNPPDCLLWQRALSAKYNGIGDFGRQEWDQLLGRCQAVTDWPAIAFSEELIVTYPEAKVILPGRDVDSWHASVLKTVYWRVTDVEFRIASYLDSTFFEDDFPNKGKAIYHEHYRKIRNLVPLERLLEYNVKQGWGPLCGFLGDPVHLDPFPHVNDTESFVARARARNRRQIVGGIIKHFIISLPLLLCMSYVVRY